MVVWAKAMPRSAIIRTRSRKLSLNVMYHLTHRMMISWSKCRPLNRSCAEVGSVIPAVIAGYQAFQQFAPEPSLPGKQHKADEKTRIWRCRARNGRTLSDLSTNGRNAILSQLPDSARTLQMISLLSKAAKKIFGDSKIEGDGMIP